MTSTHTRRGDKYVTVIIDLTPIRDGTGPVRLLDMVDWRPKQAFKQWLTDRPQSSRQGLQVVAMDGFTGFTNSTSPTTPTASTSSRPDSRLRSLLEVGVQCPHGNGPGPVFLARDSKVAINGPEHHSEAQRGLATGDCRSGLNRCGARLVARHRLDLPRDSTSVP